MKLLVVFAASIAVASAQGTAIGSLLGNSLGQGPYGGEACEAKTMSAVKKCLASYYKSYDFDIAKLPKARVYNLKLKKILEEHGGKEGVKAICKNVNPLNDCLAAVHSADTCQNVPSYTEMLDLDVSMDGATGYLITDVSLEYGCSNEKTWAENYDCINRTDIEHSEDFMKCIHDIHPVPDKCVAFNGLLGCSEKIYTKECGEGIYGFVCNLLERTMIALDPECKGKLPDCGTPKASGYLNLLPAVVLSLLPAVVGLHH